MLFNGFNSLDTCSNSSNAKQVDMSVHVSACATYVNEGMTASVYTCEWATPLKCQDFPCGPSAGLPGCGVPRGSSPNVLLLAILGGALSVDCL